MHWIAEKTVSKKDSARKIAARNATDGQEMGLVGTGNDGLRAMARPSRLPLLLAVIFIAAATLLAGCSQTSQSGQSGAATEVEAAAESSASNGTLRVAMELAYPPFETRDTDGNPTGFSVAFLERFAAEYGYGLEIENTAFDGLIPALQTDLADAVMSSITITEAREELVDFTDPYAVARLAILANAESGVESIDDLNAEGMVVAVKTGSTGDVYATENLANAEILRLTDESACVTEIVQGRADGFLYDSLTIYRNQRENPDTTEAIYIPFQDAEYWGIAVQDGDDELREQFNEFIAASRENGLFDELTEEYMAEEKAAFDELGFSWFFDFDDEA